MKTPFLFILIQHILAKGIFSGCKVYGTFRKRKSRVVRMSKQSDV
jgi:hypothetical protein